MDPDANLKEQREITQWLLAQGFDGYRRDPAVWHDKAMRLAELSQALDEWLIGGGFMPRAWRGVPAVERRKVPR